MNRSELELYAIVSKYVITVEANRICLSKMTNKFWTDLAKEILFPDCSDIKLPAQIPRTVSTIIVQRTTNFLERGLIFCSLLWVSSCYIFYLSSSVLKGRLILAGILRFLCYLFVELSTSSSKNPLTEFSLADALDMVSFLLRFNVEKFFDWLSLSPDLES